MTDQTPPVAPAPPAPTPPPATPATTTLGMATLTPADATTRLDSLLTDNAWVGRLLAGNGPEASEFRQLMTAKAGPPTGEDRIAQIINGSIEPPPFETLFDGELSTRDQASSAAWLKEAGVSEAAVREVLEGRRCTRAEYDAAKQFGASRMKNAEWVKRLLAGDHDAQREMILLSIIKTAGYEEKAAP